MRIAPLKDCSAWFEERELRSLKDGGASQFLGLEISASTSNGVVLKQTRLRSSKPEGLILKSRFARRSTYLCV